MPFSGVLAVLEHLPRGKCNEHISLSGRAVGGEGDDIGSSIPVHIAHFRPLMGAHGKPVVPHLRGAKSPAIGAGHIDQALLPGEKNQIVRSISIHIPCLENVIVTFPDAVNPHRRSVHARAVGGSHIDLPSAFPKPCGNVIHPIPVEIAYYHRLITAHGKPVVPEGVVSKAVPFRESHIHISHRIGVVASEGDDVRHPIPVEIPHHRGLPCIHRKPVVPLGRNRLIETQESIVCIHFAVACILVPTGVSKVVG